MGYAYRCSDRTNCGRRRALKHKIDWYINRPKCLGCKRDTLKPVYEKEHQRSKRRGCFCQGRHWPHNKGRVEDENHICIHVPFEEAQIYVEAFEDGHTVTIMKPEDDCPF